MIKKTKTGDTMAFLTCEDISGQIELVVFPKVYSLSRRKMEKNAILFVKGKISIREDEPVKIIADTILDPENVKPNSKNAGVYIKFPSVADGRIKQVEEIVRNAEGNVDTFFYFEDTKQLVRLPSNMRSIQSDDFLKRIKQILGEKNVAIKY